MTRGTSFGGEHSVANGLTRRSDLHRLFDRGYVTNDGPHRWERDLYLRSGLVKNLFLDGNGQDHGQIRRYIAYLDLLRAGTELEG